jgi:hypothetical protein
MYCSSAVLILLNDNMLMMIVTGARCITVQKKPIKIPERFLARRANDTDSYPCAPHTARPPHGVLTALPAPPPSFQNCAFDTGSGWMRAHDQERVDDTTILPRKDCLLFGRIDCAQLHTVSCGYERRA